MANMSYCRFENTYNDLKNCYDNIEEFTSKAEEDKKIDLLALCKRIVEDYGEYEEKDFNVDIEEGEEN